MSRYDRVFTESLKDILSGYTDEGENVRPKWKDGSPAYTRYVNNLVTTYDLQEEFPICTIRKTNWRASIDEILWIWQKKSNNVKELNSNIWDSWANKETGSIGKAYGYQLGKKIDFPEGRMDQVDWILKTLKENPFSRRMVTNIFNHEDLRDMNLQPCAYSVSFNISKHKDGSKYLNAILNQRSQDFLVANSWNVTQYAVLLHMFAISSGLKVGKLTHVISNAHIYDRHIPIIKNMIKNGLTYSAPKLKINPDVTDFYDFKVSDFELIGYIHDLDIKKIPVAI